MKELWPATAERLANDVPEARLIYLVRDPLERIESFWMQKRANGDGRIHPDFNIAVMERPDLLVDSTNYLRQLQPYRERFPAEQIKVAFFEDYRQDATAVMRDLFTYLGVDPEAQLDDAASHVNRSEGKLVYSSTIIRIRRAKWLKPMKRLLSDDLKQAIAGRFFRVPMTRRPVWHGRTRDFVLERIGADSATFLAEQGRPIDFWQLEAT